MWFDDVDPEDLEQVPGKRLKTSDKDPNKTLITGNVEGLVCMYYLSSF